MTAKQVGQGIDRIDAKLKVTGKAIYAADVPVTGVAHAVIVTSSIARGDLTSIDTAAAERAAGVLQVLTRDNIGHIQPMANKPGSSIVRVLQVLNEADIAYADQPIAVVVADTLERAQHAATLVVPAYKPRAAVADLVSVIGDAFKPKTAGPHGETDSARGNVKDGLAAARVKLTQTYTTPVENHNPMEPHATIAVWQGSDKLTLYDSTQGIFGTRDRIAALLGLDKPNVRVVNHYVGGGFGCKGSAWSHVILCALAAKAVGRPVKLVITRQQMFSLVGHRPKTVQTIALGCDAGGKLTAIRHDVVSETSRFDEFVEPSALQTRMLYACPNVATSHRLVRIDAPTPTFMRAPGESSGTFALESAMDELAVAAKLDPLELRLRNYADRDDDQNKGWSSKSLRQCYQQAAAKFGWAKRSDAPRSMRDTRTGELIGWGLATATYPTNQQPSSSRARMRPDGSVLVQAGTQDIGTGTYTIMSQIAADALGVPLETVTFELGDSTFPQTPVSGGSMTAASTGSAVKLACQALIGTLAAAAVADPASPLFGQPAMTIEGADGELVSTVDRRKHEPYRAVVARSKQPELVGFAEAKVKDETKAFSCHAFGAVFVEARVDEALAKIRIARITAAYAAGKILNPKTARSQFMGGLVWAHGMALLEASERDPRTARMVTRDLADYHVPVNADIPDIDIIMVAEDDPHVNEVGVKGIGEIGITGATAAIANALFHATGTRVRDLPLRLEHFL
jgi:xanthine dehydrogenase YagR molybdenum-binding subunit